MRSARQNDQRPGVRSIGPEKWQPLLSKCQSYTGGKVDRMKMDVPLGNEDIERALGGENGFRGCTATTCCRV